VRASVWLYPGDASAWHFVTLPKRTSAVIRKRFADSARGWGSLPVMVTVGATRWKTSIFPDRKAGAYLLPLKADVRAKEGIGVNDRVALSVEVLA